MVLKELYMYVYNVYGVPGKSGYQVEEKYKIHLDHVRVKGQSVGHLGVVYWLVYHVPVQLLALALVIILSMSYSSPLACMLTFDWSLGAVVIR